MVTLPPSLRDRVDHPARDVQRGPHRLRIADHVDRVRGRQRDAVDGDPLARVDEVGAGDDPHRRPRRRRRSASPRRPRRAAPRPRRARVSARIRSVPRREHDWSARAPRRGSVPARMPSSSARRRASASAASPALRARLELPLGVLQLGDLAAQPLLARVEVGQDPDQVLRPGVVQVGVGVLLRTCATSANPSRPEQQPDDRTGAGRRRPAPRLARAGPAAGRVGSSGRPQALGRRPVGRGPVSAR